MKVYCSTCKHILGPPYISRGHSLCCATTTVETEDESDWYSERICKVRGGHAWCREQNAKNDCSLYEKETEVIDESLL